MERTIIALQTDFGLKDHYVGTMKGKMLSIWPRLTFVDLGHDAEPFRVLPAAYALYAAWEYFPEGTIFVSVVDPGVGTSRNVLVGKTAGRILIAPDNGTAGFIVRMFGSDGMFRPESTLLAHLSLKASGTFHGRDIFGPLAATCARDGFDTIKGEACTPVPLPDAVPEFDEAKGIGRGRIVSIDRFGNCITAIHATDFVRFAHGRNVHVVANGREIGMIRSTYSDVKIKEPIAYFGSSGFLEIGVREGNASKRFELVLDDIVEATFKK